MANALYRSVLLEGGRGVLLGLRAWAKNVGIHKTQKKRASRSLCTLRTSEQRQLRECNLPFWSGYAPALNTFATRTRRPICVPAERVSKRRTPAASFPASAAALARSDNVYATGEGRFVSAGRNRKKVTRPSKHPHRNEPCLRRHYRSSCFSLLRSEESVREGGLLSRFFRGRSEHVLGSTTGLAASAIIRTIQKDDANRDAADDEKQRHAQQGRCCKQPERLTHRR